MQLTEFPDDWEALQARVSAELFNERLFQLALVASIFPVVGAVGAIGLWRWALWLYCLFLVACIGLRTKFVFDASYREGLEPRAPLLREMLLLSGGIFLQLFIFRTASRTALGEPAPTRREPPRTRTRAMSRQQLTAAS